MTNNERFELCRDICGALTDARGCLELIQEDESVDRALYVKTTHQRVMRALKIVGQLLQDSRPEKPWLEL